MKTDRDKMVIKPEDTRRELIDSLNGDNQTSKRFGLLLENYNGVWIYECKSEKQYGRVKYSRRFRGTYSNCTFRRGFVAHICAGRTYQSFSLEWQLARTDWKASTISEKVLDLILSK